MEIRNIAIIAHVDHGKTTITDALLRQNGMVEESVSMDSNSLEQERGITIYAKNASLFYQDSKINLVDTPGHADFSSEVERVLRSIDCVLLIVDAQEGPMPQTKFVLKKSLELGLKPIVVINKIDKPAARPAAVLEDVYELFLDLGANDQQLEFKTIYAIGREGRAGLDPEKLTDTLNPLLDLILQEVKPVSGANLPPAAQPFNLAYDNFLGRCAVARVYSGQFKAGQNVFILNSQGQSRSGKISKLFTFQGLGRSEVAQVEAGDIVLIAGLPNIDIGETISSETETTPLPAIAIDEPTICLSFLVNNSPFAGREGKFVTSRQIKERLEKELEVNVGLKIDFSDPASYRVYGRGELHIAVLLENMRREGYEVQVSQPQVIIKEQDGITQEPFEELLIDIPDGYTGTIMDSVSRRRGKMIDMHSHNGQTRLVFEIPTRGLLGYRNDFVVATRGEGILCSHFIGFRPHVGEIERQERGAMISMMAGKALAYSLWNLQERGVLYIPPNTEVYEGMIIGNVAKGHDMTVNPIKGKQLTNVRASGTDEAIILTPPWELTLERGLGIIGEDEYLEITPQSIRLRKQVLKEVDRNRARKN